MARTKKTTEEPTKRKRKSVNKKNGPGECSINLWQVPTAVRDTFKKRCAKAGKPMKEVLISFMRGFKPAA